MRTPAYIALGEGGRVMLYWGDGTEEKKQPILRGPVPNSSQELLEVIESMKEWAEENGYAVIVPSYDLEVPDMEIEITDHEAQGIDDEDVFGLLDDIFAAGEDAPPGDEA